MHISNNWKWFGTGRISIFSRSNRVDNIYMSIYANAEKLQPASAASTADMSTTKVTVMFVRDVPESEIVVF